MKYTVTCNQCGKKFIAQSEQPGEYKYRCPHCGHIMTCRFEQPEHFTRARSVVPVAESADVSDDIPFVETEGSEPGQTTTMAAKQAPIKWSVMWFMAHLSIFFHWSSSRIKQFRETYDDADLWLFFGFSILFIILVFVGLFCFAEIAKVVGESKSWLFKQYLGVTHLFN
ncbi:MAG: hypothetical protein SO442_03510 [Prevotella sp.]|nr:hypothetical protein [Prevotella sp.]MDD7335046.1 hypothetical protein [Prevotella sp.]MDY4625652.1 hypothetical protein [Prevotella sp.]MDY4666636.1 hypothetical protein [Prevotella sp.]MDY5258580.1 hypothetical protein [Prevotella sp.]